MDDKPEVGMTADEVLRLEGRSWLDTESLCGHDAGDGSREWVYADCTVVLRHDGLLWRVVEVRDGETAESAAAD
jgi:hypothetical protein